MNPNHATTRTWTTTLPIALLAALLLFATPLAATDNEQDDAPNESCEEPIFVTLESGDGAYSTITGEIQAEITWSNDEHAFAFGATEDRPIPIAHRVTTCEHQGELRIQLQQPDQDPFLNLTAEVNPGTPDPVEIVSSHFERGVVTFDPNKDAFTFTIGDAKGDLHLAVALPEDQEATLQIGLDRSGDGEIDRSEMSESEPVQGPYWETSHHFENLPLVTAYLIELVDDKDELLLSQAGTFRMMDDPPMGTVEASAAEANVGAQGKLSAYPAGVAVTLPGSMFAPNATEADASVQQNLSIGVNTEALEGLRGSPPPANDTDPDETSPPPEETEPTDVTVAQASNPAWLKDGLVYVLLGAGALILLSTLIKRARN